MVPSVPTEHSKQHRQTYTHTHTHNAQYKCTHYIHNHVSVTISIAMLLVLLCESVECVGELFCETAAMLLIQDQCGPALGGRGCV